MFIQSSFVELTDLELCQRMELPELVDRALDLLRSNEPDGGYTLDFSGGKDSVACKHLLQMSGVRFSSIYSVTTIDPPELIRFIRQSHGDVIWRRSKYGNMMHRVATAPKVPPTRQQRWCCEEFKEYRGEAGEVHIFGVRAAESAARKKRWNEITRMTSGTSAVCPIVYWTNDRVWEFIRSEALSYCTLYDEGFKRLGCVGCPLAAKENQNREFARWPLFERNWKRAIQKNWETFKDIPNTKTGKPRFHAQFRSGEDFYRWWRTERQPDYITGNCQMSELWTNEPGYSDDEEVIKSL